MKKVCPFGDICSFVHSLESFSSEPSLADLKAKDLDQLLLEKDGKICELELTLKELTKDLRDETTELSSIRSEEFVNFSEYVECELSLVTPLVTIATKHSSAK